MTQYKISAHVRDTAEAQAFGTALTELVEPAAIAWTRFERPDGWQVEAYWIEDVDPGLLAVSAAEIVGLASVPEFTYGAVPDENWVAISQAALPPVHAGPFAIHGSHDRARIAQGPLAIEIDAGEAFGTAHHATTSGCLAALARVMRRRRFRRALDLGCGSGVLAIAVARLSPAARIAATDIDPEAVRVARDNARRNRAGNRIAFSVRAGIAAHGPRHDLIVANILAGPLIVLAPALRPALTRGGVLILSGILDEQAARVRAAYTAQGFRLMRHDRVAGWSILTLTRS